MSYVLPMATDMIMLYRNLTYAAPCCRELAAAMKGADAVICAIGSSGFNPKGPRTVDYEVRSLACECVKMSSRSSRPQ